MTGFALIAEARGLEASVKIEEGAYRELLRGPVVQMLVRKAIRVEAAAKRNASGRPGPNVITGTLRRSITYRVGNDSVSPYVDIGTDVHYAPFVEFGHGNTPHVFPIATPGGTFTGRFGWVGSNRTKAYPFLRPALEAARE